MASDEGDIQAGTTDFSLTCIVTQNVTSGTAASPSAHWILHSPDSENSINIEDILSNSTTKSIKTLIFSPLLTSHAGLYTCEGRTQLLSVADTIDSTSPPFPIVVRCKLS